MKKINAIINRIINSFAFLLLAVLMSACNKDGIETIVIEDGQPSVAQMLIGRWNPTGGEMANPSTGEVTEDINISDVPWLDFGENGIGSWGNGGSGTGGSAGESFDWNADEGSGPIIGGGSGYDGEGPSVTLGGERWYIFQLTERILIIYRFYGDYIIIYYYYRVGDYNEPEPEPTPEPSGSLISQIYVSSHSDAFDAHYKITYSYDYDGRILSCKRYNNKENGNANQVLYEFTYTYDGNESVDVDFWTSNSLRESYRGFMNSIGLSAVYDLQAEQLYAAPEYDGNGYLISISYNEAPFRSYHYENNNLRYVEQVGGSILSYEYCEEENNSNLDLNEILYSNVDGVVAGGISMFAPFRFYGKSSNNMISKLNLGESADMYYTYSYEKNSQGQIGKIISESIDKWHGNIYSTTVYEIFYE